MGAGAKADLSNSCALAPWHAPNSSELCLELHPSPLEQVLGQLKTPGQPALAQAVQVGALQNTIQAWWGLRTPMVPHRESKKSDTCLDMSVDKKMPNHLYTYLGIQRQSTLMPILKMGLRSCCRIRSFPRCPENTVCYPKCRLEVGSVGRSLAGVPVGVVLSSH